MNSFQLKIYILCLAGAFCLLQISCFTQFILIQLLYSNQQISYKTMHSLHIIMHKMVVLKMCNFNVAGLGRSWMRSGRSMWDTGKQIRNAAGYCMKFCGSGGHGTKNQSCSDRYYSEVHIVTYNCSSKPICALCNREYNHVHMNVII